MVITKFVKAEKDELIPRTNVNHHYRGRTRATRFIKGITI